MKLRGWLHFRLQAFKWFKSVHAKLFIVTGLLTSIATIGVAYAIIDNSRKEMLDYTKQLAIQTAMAVETEIQERDEHFSNVLKIKELLETLAGNDKSIDEIDVFKAEPGYKGPSRTKVSFVTSSADDSQVTWPTDIGKYMASANESPSSRLVPLEPSETNGNGQTIGQASMGWEVYLPISSPHPGRSPIGLVRTYCDLERWEIVWHNSLARTYRILPFVLFGEFVLLWLVLTWLLNRPLKALMAAMARLEFGDAKARANVQRKDELGKIADRFNLMASQLERATEERETLIKEIQGLNTGLQERIDAALQELQLKNQELEQLLERIAFLREELGQQERLAIAGHLTAAFAHEIGTPLNLVNSHLQMLMAQGELGDKTLKRLDTIHAQIDRVGDIVRKLLLNTRRMDPHPEPILVSELVADLRRLWNPTLASHQILFKSYTPEGCTLLVDRKQMEQLFINLVNNAMDAMPQGGRIQLRITKDESSKPESPRWDVALEDTGAGIPEEVLPMVFKPLFTTKAEGKGTGLGLAICREIVRAHGGEIRIQSVPGQGTTILFSLPGA